ncbi:MAG: hypothetical protein WC376_01055 [Candidatus Nanoarchaeia archaeon]|jgi:hypothetical protein
MMLEKFLSLTESEALPFVLKNSKNIDFNEIYKNTDIAIFGDTNHSKDGIIGGFANSIKGLKNAGVDILCMEIPKNYSNLLESFYSGRNNDMLELSESLWNPLRSYILLKNAKNENINTYFIDMPLDECQLVKNNEMAAKRGEYMGNEIKKISESNPGKKIAVYCGYSHLDDNQIPKYLTSSKRFALITENQPSFSYKIIIDLGLTLFGPVKAIKSIGKKDLESMVDFDNHEYSLDGFLYFPKTKMPKGRKIINMNSESLTLPKTDISLKEADMDFSNRVESSCYQWDETNSQKISEMIDLNTDLKEGHKALLKEMLSKYVKTLANGSIKTIAYMPEYDVFSIEKVDTMCSEFDPEKNYGGLCRKTEITFNGLKNYFGFEKSFPEIVSIVENAKLSELDNLKIRKGFNYSTYYNWFDLMVLENNAKFHPELISSNENNSKFYVLNSKGVEIGDFNASTIKSEKPLLGSKLNKLLLKE